MSSTGFVASADGRATDAGLAVLRAGGNAVDAAIATNAVLAVTAPHLCGLGGDLLALVHRDGAVDCLISAGRAGSLSDAAGLRAEGHTSMPLFGDVRSVTVPGCVDGLLALHARYGSRALDGLVGRAVGLAERGFAASAPLARALGSLDDAGRRHLAELSSQASAPGAQVRRPGVARTLRAIAAGGRDAFYRGEFGHGLETLPGSTITAANLARPSAQWVQPLRSSAWGVELWVPPPPSQGYLWPAASALAGALTLPPPDDPQWAHLLVECARATGFDRPDMLFDGADGEALLAATSARGSMIDAHRARPHRHPGGAGDTTYLCVRDGSGLAVSLIQSNASGFGSHLAEPSTQINLHNRGIGFSLAEGHRAELRAGQRPPHTLVPGLATDRDGLRAVLGTMGGDSQPQILLQLAARLFHAGEHPRPAIEAARWVLRGESGFDTWTSGRVRLAVEGHAPANWPDALAALGHDVVREPAFSSTFGHAMAIARLADGSWAAAADPRTVIGTADSTG